MAVVRNTPWQWQHEIIEAAQERGWTVMRIDMREGVLLEEGIAGGIVLRLSGVTLNAAFVRSLPEAHQPAERREDGPS